MSSTAHRACGPACPGIDGARAICSPAGENQVTRRCLRTRLQHQDWWSLGLEATGPAESLRHGLEATAALVFAQALPGGVDLRIDDSRSYADWLRTR